MKDIDELIDHKKFSLEIEYNYYAKDSIDDLLSDIQADYNSVKAIERPTPTAGEEDLVLWFKLIIESPLIQYVVGEVKDELIKYLLLILLNPIIKAIKKSEKKKQILNIGFLEFQFDDVIVKIGGLNLSKFYIVSLVFSEIVNNINLMKDKCNDRIVKIETPIIRDPYSYTYSSSICKYRLYTNEPFYIPPLESYLSIWKIWLPENRFLFYDVKGHDYVAEENLVI